MERSNKREKEDYKLEDGRHRSTKMWYCRLYGIMMLQHLDAWEMPSAEAFQESLLGLLNINQRIQLLFGESFGLSFENTETMAVAIVTIPLKTGENTYAEDDYCR